MTLADMVQPTCLNIAKDIVTGMVPIFGGMDNTGQMFPGLVHQYYDQLCPACQSCNSNLMEELSYSGCIDNIHKMMYMANMFACDETLMGFATQLAGTSLDEINYVTDPLDMNSYMVAMQDVFVTRYE